MCAVCVCFLFLNMLSLLSFVCLFLFVVRLCVLFCSFQLFVSVVCAVVVLLFPFAYGGVFLFSILWCVLVVVLCYVFCLLVCVFTFGVLFLRVGVLGLRLLGEGVCVT